MEIAGFTNSFASGEIAREAWERTDLQQSQTGCEEAFNFIGLVSGPNASRGGFLRAGSAKASDRKIRVFPWLRADGEGLVLEVGHLYARVWTARGARVMNGAAPMEFAHGYSEADLAGLRLQQIGDIAILTSRDGLKPARWARATDTSWAVTLYPLSNGPWLPQNTDPARTLTLEQVGPTWTLQASFNLFEAGHVGAQFLLWPPGAQPSLRSWAPTFAFGADEYVLSAGRVYQNMSGSTNSGNTVPVHDRGTVSDGAIQWRFAHDGAGYVVVETVVDPQNATVSIPFETPFQPPGPHTTPDWAEAAFSDVRGWPTAQAAVREERLALAGSHTQPNVVELSRTAGFNVTGADFKFGLGTGQVLDDDAVTVGVGSTRPRVVALVDAQNLVVLTTRAEYVLSGGTVDDPIAPAAATPRPISAHGSADVMPVVVQGPPSVLIHVARGGNVLREIQIGGDRSTAGRDLSLLSQHVFGLGVVEMAWSQPDNNLWLMLSDGSLAALTYHVEHGVLGVRRQPIAGGWKAEGICASPDPQGRDRLHVAAVRTKGAETQRAHFVLALRGDDLFMDCAGVYDGAPTDLVGGLAHLDGETVKIVADGAQLPDQVVEGGQVTLPAPASLVKVGLPLTRRFKSLPLDPQGSGSMLMRKSRATQGYVVMDCVEAQVGVEVQDDPEDVQPFERVTSRRPGDAIPVLRRRRQQVTFGAGADRDPRLVVQTDAPFDLIVHALRPKLTTEAP